MSIHEMGFFAVREYLFRAAETVLESPPETDPSLRQLCEKVAAVARFTEGTNAYEVSWFEMLKQARLDTEVSEACKKMRHLVKKCEALKPVKAEEETSSSHLSHRFLNFRLMPAPLHPDSPDVDEELAKCFDRTQETEARRRAALQAFAVHKEKLKQLAAKKNAETAKATAVVPGESMVVAESAATQKVDTFGTGSQDLLREYAKLRGIPVSVVSADPVETMAQLEGSTVPLMEFLSTVARAQAEGGVVDSRDLQRARDEFVRNSRIRYLFVLVNGGVRFGSDGAPVLHEESTKVAGDLSNPYVYRTCYNPEIGKWVLDEVGGKGEEAKKKSPPLRGIRVPTPTRPTPHAGAGGDPFETVSGLRVRRGVSPLVLDATAVGDGVTAPKPVSASEKVKRRIADLSDARKPAAVKERQLRKAKEYRQKVLAAASSSSSKKGKK